MQSEWTWWRASLLSILLTWLRCQTCARAWRVSQEKERSFCQATRWGIKNAVTNYNLGNVQKPKKWARRGNWVHFCLTGHWAFSNVPVPRDLFQTMTTFKFFWSCQLSLKENSFAYCFPGNRGLLAWAPVSSLLSSYKLILTVLSLFSKEELPPSLLCLWDYGWLPIPCYQIILSELALSTTMLLPLNIKSYWSFPL